MARSPREEFERERAKIIGNDPEHPDCNGIDDPDARIALAQFANALDPERSRPTVPEPRRDKTIKGRAEFSNRSAAEYLRNLRLAHERGLDLLGVDADGFNDFMHGLVDGKLPDYDGSMTKPSARKWQAAARAFYRFCAEPGTSDRPEVNVQWPADAIIMFSERSDSMYTEGDMYTDDEIDALREATLKGENPRRDRAFLELLAGTVQRIYAIITLRVGDVHTDPDPDDSPVPYMMLNEEIKDDGDKGAIDKTGRWKPIVSDVGPVREWLRNHPFRDADVRREHGAPDRFEDCYLFIGDLSNNRTDGSDHWDRNSSTGMLKRLKARTARMSTVETVDKKISPHGFRHWAYTKSKELPIDEDIRRKVFGWAPGSTVGDETYGHVEARKAAEQFAEAWADAFGDGDIEGVAEAVVGAAAAGDVPPETRRALVQDILADDEAKQELAAAVADALAE